MWLWDINNINFILGYKKYYSRSTMDFFYQLSQGTVNRQEHPELKPQKKVNAHENKKEG